MDAPVPSESVLPVVESVKDAVARLGGRQTVANLCAVSDKAVHNWIAWDALPSRLPVYRAMTGAAERAGFAIAEHLFRVASTKDGEQQSGEAA